MYEGIEGAIILSLISFAMVFVILSLLALLMVGLKLIVQLFSKKVALEKEAPISAKEEIEITKEGKTIFTPKEQEVVSGAKEDKNEEIIAVISAALASYMSRPIPKVRVISIKRATPVLASPWAIAGKQYFSSERILVSARKKGGF
jgi:Na+-transporting methylmalonyl-CoA/oxaloacetate decarboxylase gamma subunit